MVEVADTTLDDDWLCLVEREDLASDLVRTLMPGDAVILDPALVFLNYVDASQPASGWHDSSDEGSGAEDRARALLRLYPDRVREGLVALRGQGKLAATMVELVREQFGLDLDVADTASA